MTVYELVTKISAKLRPLMITAVAAAVRVSAEVRKHPVFLKSRTFVERVILPRMPDPEYFCLISLAVLSIIALGGYVFSGTARRTVVFYRTDGTPDVEERFITRTGNRDDDIKAFVDELVLGPSDLDSVPLVNSEASLESFFVREGTVYVGLSAGAGLPVRSVEGAPDGIAGNLRSMERDIKRNFPFVRGVRFFIAGREVEQGG